MSTKMEQALLMADDTRDAVIKPGALAELGPFFRKNFGEKKPVFIADRNTLGAIGGAEKSVSDTYSVFLFPNGIHAEMDHVDRLRASHLFEAEDAVPIAVGSGTVNDLTKYTASLYHKPYGIVGTAASMDGYTSFGASIEYQHCKQTFSCPAPAALLIDTDVAAAAPEGMSASGYADLAAKIPAGADWMLADRIGTEPIDSDAWHLVQDDLCRWLAGSEKIPMRDPEAIGGLIEGLVFSGLAMQKAKSSRTASGAEHQFSHLLDNERHTFHGQTPSHGFKVGVGTIATCALYEKVLEWPPAVFERVLANPEKYYKPWIAVEAEIAGSFTDRGLVDACLKQCRQKFVDITEYIRRMDLFRSIWPEFKEELRSQLIPAAEMQRMIHAAGAPSTPEEIGLTRSRYQTCYAKARLLRYRYNVLDLVSDAGLWDETVGALFTGGGFWAL